MEISEKYAFSSDNCNSLIGSFYEKDPIHWGHRLLTWASNSFDKSISNQSITGEIAKVASFMPRIK